MKKKQKIIIAVVLFLLVIIGVIIFLNSFVKNEIVKGLDKVYPASALSYDEIFINVLAGNATIKNLRIKDGVFSLQSSEVNLKNFSYSDFLKNEDITIGSVSLLDPQIIFNKSDSTDRAAEQQGEPPERKIRVKRFIVSGGNVRMIENDTAPNTLYASLQNIRVGELMLDKMEEGNLLPFSYETIDFKSDSLYYEMSDTHYMKAKLLNVNNEDLSVNDLSIIPKYPKGVFDKRIPYEQDWIALKIDKINFSQLKMQKEGDHALFTIPLTTIENAHLEIYRNKLLQEDTRIKPMYSQMLRDLDLKINLDSVSISNTYIEYQEQVLETREAGKLSFENVNASIKNLTNNGLDSPEFPVTYIEASALFMGETALTLSWDFDVSNEMDEFRIRGRLGSIKAGNMNAFLVPAMNVEAEGNIESLYYDFYGNRNQANGSMRLSYRDFKVNILRDGESKRRGLLSGLANLILKNDRVNEDVQQENISTTRDKTKSFWNFLWLCIRDGALNTFF